MSPSTLFARGAIALRPLALSLAHAADRPKLTAEKWPADITSPR